MKFSMVCLNAFFVCLFCFKFAPPESANKLQRSVPVQNPMDSNGTAREHEAHPGLHAKR